MSALGARYSLQSRAFSILAAPNYDPVYPASELARHSAPFSLARTLDNSSGEVILDLGAGAPPIEAFSFEGMNFGALNIAKSATGVGAWTSTGDFDTSGIRGYGGRRIVVCLPEVPFDERYVRLTPADLDAGATVFEWGIAAPWPALVAMTALVGLPYGRRVDARTETQPLGGGGTQYGVPGERYVQITFSGEAFDDEPDQRAQYQALANQPDGRVFLWWEELYGGTAAYHVRRTAAVSFTIDAATDEAISGVQLTEVVN